MRCIVEGRVVSSVGARHAVPARAKSARAPRVHVVNYKVKFVEEAR